MAVLSIADFETVYAVSQHSSLAAVARALNVSQPAVSQRINALESRLRFRLVERTGRSGLVLTSDGSRLAERAKHILAEVDAAVAEVAESRREILGHLSVIAPFGFGRAYIAPAVASFHREHPQVSIKLSLSDALGRLPSAAWDVIIHVGPLQESRLVAVALAPNERYICAAPGYLERHGGNPASPEELSRFSCLALEEDFQDANLWRFSRKGQEKDKINVRVEPILASNDGDVVRSWMLKGLGIAQRSEWSVANDIRDGRLVRILPDFGLPPAPVVALVSTRNERSSRVQAFIDHVRAILTPPPWRSG